MPYHKLYWELQGGGNFNGGPRPPGPLGTAPVHVEKPACENWESALADLQLMTQTEERYTALYVS